MIDASWHGFLRDILIIVAAGALIVSFSFSMLVAWQLYRFAKEFAEEVEPIIAAMQDTAETVRDTSEFVGVRVVAPTADALGGVVEAAGVMGLIRRFYTRGA